MGSRVILVHESLAQIRFDVMQKLRHTPWTAAQELRSILAASNQSRAHIDLSSACLSPHTTRCVQALMINAVNCCAGGKVTRDAGPVKGATSEIAFIEVRACGRCCIAVTQNSLLSCLQSQYDVAVLGPECCCPMLLCLS